MPSSEPPEAFIDIDLIDFDDDLALLDGVPFTGVVCARYPNGIRELERHYREGLPDGLNETWYPNGQLFSRWMATRGFGASESWTWYPEGTRRSYRRNGDDGLPVELLAWDVCGEAIDPATQPPTSRADTRAELFDRASALMAAVQRSDGTIDQPDLDLSS